MATTGTRLRPLGEGPMHAGAVTQPVIKSMIVKKHPPKEPRAVRKTPITAPGYWRGRTLTAVVIRLLHAGSFRVTRERAEKYVEMDFDALICNHPDTGAIILKLPPELISNRMDLEIKS
ncbi:hypothetical protein NDU88_003058 [Pleurodeles waltl]|uniref:Uncharacterized protein n=1 Tax=Pleurodeles waltl TaxID=8319 RepID=A0AAV7UBG6_PLEWA|nr:hypothetical protein NDU88_003058 [Pleurodeles waltl]